MPADQNPAGPSSSKRLRTGYKYVSYSSGRKSSGGSEGDVLSCRAKVVLFVMQVQNAGSSAPSVRTGSLEMWVPAVEGGSTIMPEDAAVLRDYVVMRLAECGVGPQAVRPDHLSCRNPPDGKRYVVTGDGPRPKWLDRGENTVDHVEAYLDLYASLMVYEPKYRGFVLHPRFEQERDARSNCRREKFKLKWTDTTSCMPGARRTARSNHPRRTAPQWTPKMLHAALDVTQRHFLGKCKLGVPCLGWHM